MIKIFPTGSLSQVKSLEEFKEILPRCEVLALGISEYRGKGNLSAIAIDEGVSDTAHVALVATDTNIFKGEIQGFVADVAPLVKAVSVSYSTPLYNIGRWLDRATSFDNLTYYPFFDKRVTPYSSSYVVAAQRLHSLMNQGAETYGELEKSQSYFYFNEINVYHSMAGWRFNYGLADGTKFQTQINSLIYASHALSIPNVSRPRGGEYK